MSRSERWNTVNEIKRRFHETTETLNGAGPVVYVENGRKYSDDTESHIAVIGRTGKGKSQCCSLPYMREILQKGESLIMLDPKGEGYKKNACYIPENYQVFCVDFRNPRKSPTKWNPLSTPYRLFRSKDPDDNDIASSMLSELWNGVYPYDGHSDKFWTDSSVNYAKGLTYGLFETAGKDTINLDSVAVMMEQSEIRFGGPGNTILKEFYEQLPLDSLAKRNLATYVAHEDKKDASRSEKVQFALAGVEMNLLIAGICLLIATQYYPLSLVLVSVANINVVLAGINLLPASGLDGESALSAVFGVNSISEVARKCLLNKKHRQKLLRSGFSSYACYCVFAFTMISKGILWLLIVLDIASVFFNIF